jgi:hypothetical protein
MLSLNSGATTPTWVVFCQIFGTMINLPKDWPMYCRDIQQFADDLVNPELPVQTSQEHNALNDARWNFKAWKFLNKTWENSID